jgi:hypothetical protein
MNKFAMQLAHLVRVIQYRLGDKGAGLQIAPAFKLKQIALGAYNRAVCEAFH